MAKVRSHVVSRASCAVVSRELGLGERLLQEAAGLPVDEVQRLARNRNVLAALLEAAIAAVYIEHGFEAVEPAVVAAFDPRIEYALTSHVDHKTELQEQLARRGHTVSYATLKVEGPAARPLVHRRRNRRRRGARHRRRTLQEGCGAGRGEGSSSHPGTVLTPR